MIPRSPVVSSGARAGGEPPPVSSPAPLLRFTALGVPQPQGSTRAFVVNGHAVTTSANKNLRPWRNTMSLACADAARHLHEPLTGPLLVRVVFTLPKPASAPKTRRVWPSKRPDLDKLVRGCFDAVTDCGCWVDDAQVVELVAAKAYPNDGREDSLNVPGVVVTIEQVTT